MASTATMNVTANGITARIMIQVGTDLLPSEMKIRKMEIGYKDGTVY